MFTSLLQIADYARHQGRSRTWDAGRATGRRGEDIAHRYLQRIGMVVVARNHTTPGGSGEVDLVAWERDTLVFVEVKCRDVGDYGPPERAIDQDKERKIILAARDYARRANIPWESARFDTVSIVLRKPPYVAHYRDSFSARARANA